MTTKLRYQISLRMQPADLGVAPLSNELTIYLTKEETDSFFSEMSRSFLSQATARSFGAGKGPGDKSQSLKSTQAPATSTDDVGSGGQKEMSSRAAKRRDNKLKFNNPHAQQSDATGSIADGASSESAHPIPKPPATASPMMPARPVATANVAGASRLVPHAPSTPTPTKPVFPAIPSPTGASNDQPTPAKVSPTPSTASSTVIVPAVMPTAPDARCSPEGEAAKAAEPSTAASSTSSRSTPARRMRPDTVGPNPQPTPLERLKDLALVSGVEVSSCGDGFLLTSVDDFLLTVDYLGADGYWAPKAHVFLTAEAALSALREDLKAAKEEASK